jgi:hypothetical protein
MNFTTDGNEFVRFDEHEDAVVAIELVGSQSVDVCRCSGSGLKIPRAADAFCGPGARHRVLRCKHCDERFLRGRNETARVHYTSRQRRGGRVATTCVALGRSGTLVRSNITP